MATTGGHVWPAARRLLEYIEATKPPEIVNEGARILELGSGTGWMGMTLAANLPDATQLCVTEMEAGGALTWLRKNVARNEDDGFFFVMLDVEATRPGNVIADDFRSPLRLEDCAMEKYPSV